jgi:hypothetical protein
MNLEVETSLAAWLRSQPAFDGIPVHTGQSSDPIPNDQPVLIVGVDSSEVIAAQLYKLSVSIVAATPCIVEGALEAHSGISANLRTAILAADQLAASFPASITLAGAVLASISETRESDRWLTTASLTLGLIAPI